MLYKKNIAEKLNDELFLNPTSEYRGTPFWAWNSYLTKEELCRQIDVFKEMGLGGFHMHVRTGLENEYLSEEFMGLVKTCIDKAKENEMLAWAYDEDRWPSGAAGGLVTKDEKYRGRCLLFTPFKEKEAYMTLDSRAEGGRSGKGKLLACYDIVLDENGCLKEYSLIDENEEAKGTKWYAFLEINTSSSWYNNQTYLDTLNKEAVERFVEVTHETYKKYCSEDFGETLPAIFTDEPQFIRKQVLENSFDKMDVAMPWTDSIPASYEARFGADIFATLPEVFWDLPDGKISLHRYRYHDHISEVFASSFADTIGSWCRENGIALTGHMMEEPTLHSQTAAIGDAMRSYRGFDLPGIDLLCNSHEFTTAKQAQSAAHQFGYEGVLSELYGVTGWDADFRTYKHQGDWQAALGITVRVPHLSWYAMGGEAKRDYPASIHYQSAWYKDYKKVEDHFARVNTAMTRGKPVVKVGVIHPVESFWLHWGPNDKSAVYRESLDENFLSLTSWLLEGSVDFDFICESLLPSQCKNGTSPLKVGKMEYDTILVPACETLRSTTVERLEAFAKSGGKLIFAGAAPTLVDAQENNAAAVLYNESIAVDFTRAAILNALEDSRTVTLRYDNGRLCDKLFYQLRQDTDCKWLFLAFNKEPYNKDLIREDDIVITVKGIYSPVKYDTYSGEITPVSSFYRDGNTLIPVRMWGYDSLLLRLDDGECDIEYTPKDYPFEDFTRIKGAVNYKLHEENVLLLDMAEHKLDFEADFSEREEILRLDNICREKLGIIARGGGVCQPWALGAKKLDNKVTLKFTIESEIEYKGALLALEDASSAEITFNGKAVSNEALGFYTDISISKVALPDIKKGENTLLVTLPFGERAGLENMFILGNFGVSVVGDTSKITALPEKLYFGDITRQGLPFYGGKLTYSFTCNTDTGNLSICTSYYKGAVVNVSCDGEEKGSIIYPPYTLEMDSLSKGEHSIDLTLSLHRYNTFGPLHLVDEHRSWHGPDAWRTTEEDWSYEYIFRKTGILKAPEIYTK
ncbi:MAG: hypothetical protein IKJ88_07935 [Clostridia bacterium]|nr:hypothetical protein [Clostridia bacterium]